MYEELYSWENILTAYRKAAKGKRSTIAVAQFERYLEGNLVQLQIDLKTKIYRPGAYKNFFIHEPKRRLISAAPFRDRVVHHALCQLIEPRFERSFIFDSYANRKGKGTHRALDRAQYFSQRYKYVLHLDVQQFFPSIDHDELITCIKRKVDDLQVLKLVQAILESGLNIRPERTDYVYFGGDDLFARLRPRGLPIGNLTSQFWGNVYMNSLDHFVKRTLRCKAYLRYVDDLLLFAPGKNDLWNFKKAIEERLKILRLHIHAAAHPRPVKEGFTYLGFVLYPDHRKVLRRKVVHFRRKSKHLAGLVVKGKLEYDTLQASVGGWINHVRYGNTVGLQKAVLKEIAEELNS